MIGNIVGGKLPKNNSTKDEKNAAHDIDVLYS